jgi:lipopolysaccharide biosynthesis regulator YciM
MNDLAVFGLLFAAVAIGWLLGRHGPGSSFRLSRYFTGPAREFDRAAEMATVPLIDELPVDEGSTQLRIAQGVRLRRRGEVAGAVRIHQDLLSGVGLPADDVAQAQLELARDYISAGLLDRAEELLLELGRDFPRQRQAARRHLLEVYEIERDWRRAIEVARALLPHKTIGQGRTPGAAPERGQRAAQLLAHYCCELAGEERLAGDLESARKLLLEALFRDRRCVRASLVLAQVEYDDARYRQAIKALRRVQVQDPDYLPETIELLRRCYAALGDPQSLREYLLECLAARPTPALVAAVAEDMAQVEGAAAASDFLAAQLPKYPSLGGLQRLIGLQVAGSEGRHREDLALLAGLARSLVANRPAYRCGRCGFAGKYLHWHCPGCKHWGSIRAIGGSDTH